MITQEEIRKIAKLATLYVSEEEIGKDLAVGKAIDFIKENAVITEAAEEKKDEAAAEEKKPAAKKPAAKKPAAAKTEAKPAAKKPAAKKPAAKTAKKDAE